MRKPGDCISSSTDQNMTNKTPREQVIERVAIAWVCPNSLAATTDWEKHEVERLVIFTESIIESLGYVQKAEDQKTILFHKVLGNVDNPTEKELTCAKSNIVANGLIAKIPKEWKFLLPEHLQSTPVVWLIGHNRMILVKEELLDKEKLFHLDNPEVDWWVYAGNIPPEAIKE